MLQNQTNSKWNTHASEMCSECSRLETFPTSSDK